MKAEGAAINGRGRTPPSTEDRYFSQELPGEMYIAGVFDGHSGSFTVDYTIQNFPKILAAIAVRARGDMSVIQTELRRAFIEHDKNLAKQGFQKYDTSGTTATVVVITATQCLIAYIGDSPACCIGPDGTVLHSITGHSPDDAAEKQRIVRNGGHVTNDRGDVARVNGELAVARAFGDFSLKFKNQSVPNWEANWATDFKVIADPEFLVFSRPAKGVLAIFSDGLIETSGPNLKPISAVATSISQSIMATRGNLKGAAELTIKKHVAEFTDNPIEYDGDDTTLLLIDIGTESNFQQPQPLPQQAGGVMKMTRKERRRRHKTGKRKLLKTFIL